MTLVIDCERLFDGTRVIGPAQVTVEGDRIAAVANGSGPRAVADGAEHLSVRFAMPGLIDSHVHVAGYVEGSPAGVPFKPVKDFLRLLILNGITTVRDTGNAIETIRYVRDWGDRFGGPRVFAAGPLLDIPPLVWPFSRIVRDPATARREVELLHLEGMDFVKSYRNVSTDVLGSIVETARERGMDVAADVRAATALEASRLGVRSLEHAMNLFDERSFPNLDPAAFWGPQGRARIWARVDPDSPEVAALGSELAGRGTFVCPTLLVTHRWCDMEAMVNERYLDYMVAVMPYHQHFKKMRGSLGMAIGRKFFERYIPVPRPGKAEKAEINEGLAHLRAVVARLHAAGVPLAVGTDAPNPSIVPGFSLHQEMELLVQGGMPPEAVLAGATSAAADLLRRDDLGRLRPGALADLLLLDGDPTTDITNTMDIHAVVKAGKVIDRRHVLAKFRESLDNGR
jgi:imidazolonepropionase-like amidohydrolase